MTAEGVSTEDLSVTRHIFVTETQIHLSKTTFIMMEYIESCQSVVMIFSSGHIYIVEE